MALPLTRLQTLLDTELPNSGIIGYIALIQNVTYTGTFTINTATDVITLGSTPTTPLATGCRGRITSTGTLPGVNTGIALSSTTDYYWRVITSTTGKLYRTLEDCQADTNAIDFSNSGSGTLTFTEQALNASLANPDPLNVVLSKELPSGGGYSSRIAMNNLGASVIISNRAEKSIAFTLTGDATGYTYRYYQLIIGGSATIGNTTGTQSYLIGETVNKTVNSGNPNYTFLTCRLSSP